MKSNKIVIILLFSLCTSIVSYGQGKVTRSNASTNHTQQPKKTTNVPQLSVSGSINGHDYVDLGLPSGTLWATCNIGASDPIGFGEYFAWAEISAKDEYSYFTSKSHKWLFRDLRNSIEESLYLKAPTDQVIGNPEYDAARAQWGNEWALPSKKNFEELVAKCKWKLITLKGIKGFLVTGSNGNKIFFPLAGYMEKAGPAQLHDEQMHGVYWTGDYNDETSNETHSYAFCLYHPQYNKGVTPHYRHCGHSIRPVVNRNR